MGGVETEDSEGGRRRSSGMHIFFFGFGDLRRVDWGLEPDDVVWCWAICAGSVVGCGGNTERKNGGQALEINEIELRSDIIWYRV